ncbi:methionyl-tRNA formyltransferase [Dendrosporobacter sp. 1207_IL3150]|uniref:methionyl-tRNA formyltransferase n=1 Tax=Dendrosporobacter sp. 1207_IL3150 TaxID=3084054 RepID=UPI002FD8A32B
MNNLRVVFMGTPDFAVPCLEMLVKEKYEVVAVVTQPDRPKGRGQKLMPSPVKEFALNNGLQVIQPAKIKTPEFEHKLSELNPDIIIVVAFGQILSKRILEIPPLGCINVHASLLPRYRGAAPIHWAVINGETSTGVTTMFMDVGLDTGDMILKAEIAISDSDNTGDIHDKLKELGAITLRDTMTLVQQQKVKRVPQNVDEATYAPLLNKDIEKIDWNLSATQIHNLVRGLNPWPGAYCLYQNKILKIWRTRVHEADVSTSRPGRVMMVTNEGILIEAGRGVIEILELQPESKKRMLARDCACGYCINVGEIFG